MNALQSLRNFGWNFSGTNKEEPASTSEEEQLARLYEEDIPSISSLGSLDEKRDVLAKKLRLCSFMFDFENPVLDENLIEKKTKTLEELVAAVPACPELFNLEFFTNADFVAMMNSTFGQPMPLSETFKYGSKQNDPSWPHLQIVYEFVKGLLAAVVDDTTNGKNIAPVIRVLGGRLITEDPDEWNVLTGLMQSLFDTSDNMKNLIRTEVIEQTMKVISEQSSSSMLSTGLMLVGQNTSFIGYSTYFLGRHLVRSVKASSWLPEHKRRILFNTLIPLYKEEWIDEVTFEKISKCVSKFTYDDPRTCPHLSMAMIEYWPQTNAHLAVLSLSRVLKITLRKDMAEVVRRVYEKFAECLESGNEKVIEAVLIELNKIRNKLIIRFYRHAPMVLIKPFALLDTDPPKNQIKLFENVKNAVLQRDWAMSEFTKYKNDPSYQLLTEDQLIEKGWIKKEEEVPEDAANETADIDGAESNDDEPIACDSDDDVEEEWVKALHHLIGQKNFHDRYDICQQHSIKKQIFLATDTTNEAEVAIYFYEDADTMHEIQKLRGKLSDSHFCKIVDVIEAEESHPSALVFEQAHQCMTNWQCPQDSKEVEAEHAAINILEGLKQLHDKHYVHSQVEACNLMWFPEESTWKWMLPDKCIKIGDNITNRRITQYTSPEIVIGSINNATTIKASPAMDLWSFGLVMYEYYNAAPLFESPIKLKITLEKERRLPEILIPHRRVLTTIDRVLKVDPNVRATTAEALRDLGKKSHVAAFISGVQALGTKRQLNRIEKNTRITAREIVAGNLLLNAWLETLDANEAELELQARKGTPAVEISHRSFPNEPVCMIHFGEEHRIGIKLFHKTGSKLPKITVKEVSVKPDDGNQESYQVSQCEDTSTTSAFALWHPSKQDSKKLFRLPTMFTSVSQAHVRIEVVVKLCLEEVGAEILYASTSLLCRVVDPNSAITKAKKFQRATEEAYKDFPDSVHTIINGSLQLVRFAAEHI